MQKPIVLFGSRTASQCSSCPALLSKVRRSACMHFHSVINMRIFPRRSLRRCEYGCKRRQRQVDKNGSSRRSSHLEASSSSVSHDRDFDFRLTRSLIILNRYPIVSTRGEARRTMSRSPQNASPSLGKGQAYRLDGLFLPDLKCDAPVSHSVEKLSRTKT